jgi:polygalacturonase
MTAISRWIRPTFARTAVFLLSFGAMLTPGFLCHGQTNPAKILKSEAFQSALSAATDGWTEQGCRLNGENYGFSNSVNAGGPAGEAGGQVTRNSIRSAYADVWDSQTYGALSLDDPLVVTGKVVFVSTNGILGSDPSFGIGFTSSTQVGLSTEDDELGVLITGNGRLDAHIGLTGGAKSDFQETTGIATMVAGRAYSFDFEWNPNGGTHGGGLLTVHLFDPVLGTTKTGTVDLTAANRALNPTFDSFGIFTRAMSSTTAQIMTCYVDTLTYNALPGMPCEITEAPAFSRMAAGQINNYMTITIPGNVTIGTPVAVTLVSANPAVAYPAEAPGGSLTVIFSQNSTYFSTNVPLSALADGSALFYLTNATAPACISATAGSTFISVGSDSNSPALPVIPSGTFLVTDHGAVGNGVVVNTAAIQATVNAAIAAGGGTVEVPAGTFLSGPFSIGSKIRFQLDAGATLLMLPYGTYPGGSNPPDFISVSSAHDIEFCGPGILDGQGAPWWAAGLNESARPYAIHLDDVQRVFFHDWNSTNPPMKHIVFDGDDSDITIQNVTNCAPESSPNTDGLNLQGNRCLVRDCVFRVGDDCIAMGRSSGTGQNILITNITCGTGHGISIGSITQAGISNVTVVNCTFDGTQYGLRLKSDNDRGGVVQNIRYENITLTNVHSAILIYSYYNGGHSLNVTPASAASYGVSPVTSQTPIWRNITFSNITAWTTTEAGMLWGRPEMLVSNITLDHVTINSPKTFRIYNSRGIQLVDTKITPSSGTTYTLYNGEATVTNRTPGARTVSFDGLTSSNALALYNAPAAMVSTDLFGTTPITLNGSAITNNGSLVLPASSVFNFAPGTNDSLLFEYGNLTLNSTLNIQAGAGFKPGTYTLMRYTGTLDVNSSPTLGDLPTGYQGNLDLSTLGQVRLVASAQPPMIGNFSLDGSGGLMLSGTGGPANYNYYVVCSTNLALPLSNWTRVTTNWFDSLGNFSVTGLTNLDPQMFYRLQVP